jgi:response regulator of citrate/malate metabolism
MTPKPNSPEAFEICRRVREANRIKSVYHIGGTRGKSTKPRKPRTKITDEIIRRVYELSDEGLSAVKVAEAVGIAKATVFRIRTERREHYGFD